MEPPSMTRSIPRASARAGTRARLSLGLAPALLPGAPVPPVGEEASAVNVAADRPGSTPWPPPSTSTGRASTRRGAAGGGGGQRRAPPAPPGGVPDGLYAAGVLGRALLLLPRRRARRAPSGTA